MRASTALALALPFAPGCGPASSAAGPGFEGPVLATFRFEDGVGAWSERKLPREDALTLVADPTGAVNRVARFELRRDDPQVADGRRAELQLDDVGRAGSAEDRWYGFSTYVAPDWEADPAYEVLAQWKGARDKPEEQAKSPQLALRVRGETVYWTSRWDARRITPDNDSPGATVWEGALERGRWIEWTVHVRWSYEDDGLLRIWRDGRPIVNRTGPNAYNDERGIYFKIGIYKPPWDDPVGGSATEKRVVYHDDVWLGLGE